MRSRGRRLKSARHEIAGSGAPSEPRLIMDEPRIRAATAADVPGIADIVTRPIGPMLDDYAARVLEGVPGSVG
jgi:hypothetical protein